MAITTMTEATKFRSIDRLSPAQRPTGRPAGYHRWRNLAFIHWRVPAELIEPLIPAELTLDTWKGDAWVGLVPFQMSGVRPWWGVPLPRLSAFPETNVRTYVHFCGRDPGVWFFSLEADNPLAVWLARVGWSLDYYWAQMTIEKAGRRIRYQSRRRATDRAGCLVEMEIGRGLDPVQPDTLEHFLIERYILYTRSRRGLLRRGQVHHRPYQLHEARLIGMEETLLAANRLPIAAPPCHVVFSPGVSVEVFPLTRVAAAV